MERIKTSLHQLTASDFMRMNAIFFVGSLFVSFLNYLYYPIVGRMLPKEAFGEVQALVSFFLTFTVFLTALTFVTVNFVVNEKEQKAQKIMIELEKFALFFGFIILAIMLITAEFLRDALKFDSPGPFILIGLIILLAIPLAFRSAYLRGKRDFTGASISGAIAAASKILLSVTFVVLGLKTSGAIGGLLASQIIALIYTYFRAKKYGLRPQTGLKLMPDFKFIFPYLKYVGFVFIVSMVIIGLFSLDSIIVKYFFSPELAGEYAGVSTVARIIFFIVSPVAIVLLSIIKFKGSRKENYQNLRKTLILTILIGGSVTLFFCLFPTWTLNTLMGSQYDKYATLLPLLSISVLLLSLSNVFTNYFMALRDSRVLTISLSVFLVLGLLTFLNHDKVANIVQNTFISSSMLLTLLIIMVMIDYRKEVNNDNE